VFTDSRHTLSKQYRRQVIDEVRKENPGLARMALAVLCAKVRAMSRAVGEPKVPMDSPEQKPELW
jgi:hypothetical protein